MNSMDNPIVFHRPFWATSVTQDEANVSFWHEAAEGLQLSQHVTLEIDDETGAVSVNVDQQPSLWLPGQDGPSTVAEAGELVTGIEKLLAILDEAGHK